MTSFIRKLFASELKEDEKPKFFFWYPPGTTKETKKFLWKLDLVVVTYGCLSYWVKYLDSANITNAYVSGMKEDLGLLGNELTWFTTYFTIGTALATIPSNYLITIIRPRYLLPGAEILWGILTLALYKAPNARFIYGMRFLIGFLEGSTFVGMIYLLGSWYSKRELGRRMAIFVTVPSTLLFILTHVTVLTSSTYTSFSSFTASPLAPFPLSLRFYWVVEKCAYLGSMFSGYMTSAIYKNMDGLAGLAGWRWLFIIDSLITFVVAGFGLAFFPDTPRTTTAFWLTPAERKFAVDRLIPEGRGEEHNAGGWSVFRRLLNKRTALLVCTWIGWSNTLGKYVGTLFALYLKSNPGRWSVYQINNIPTSSSGFNILMMLGTGWFIDMTGRRYAVIFTCLAVQTLGTVLYLVYDIGTGGQIAALLLGALDGPTSPIVMTYANLLLSGDMQSRALTIAVMNSFGSAVSSIVNNYGFKATQAPRMTQGVGLALGFVLFELVCVTTLRYVELSTSAERDLAEKTDKLEGGSGSLSGSAEDEKLAGEGAVMPVATK